MSFTKSPNLNDLINASKIQADSAHRLKEHTDPFVGTVIGAEYAILEVIGEGGMARVYKAKQISVDRFVALKILTTDEPESVARFAREVRIHGRLKHKNIVQALDCVCDTRSGKTLFVMEFLNGPTLGELIRDTQNGIHNEQDIFGILTQLCDALEHAHNRGIIHRDLKPNNVVLLQEGDNLVVKVVDFGIARVQEDMQRLTQAGVVVGSPGYMSPEHCKGKEPDRRADVYSLGAIAFALMTGRVPYPEPDLRSMMLAHCDPLREPPPIEETCPEIRGAKQLNAIIRKAMQTDRDSRFRSAGELKQALIFWYGSVLSGDTQADLPVIVMPEESPTSTSPVTTQVRSLTTSQQKSLRDIVTTHQEAMGGVTREQWKCPELFITGIHKGFSGEERPTFSTAAFNQISLSTPLVGRILANKYRVLDVLGEGGMSVVYSAIDLRSRELVAIKTLKFAEPELSARFAREMQIHLTLRHQNIVRAIECLEANGGQSYFVMELLKGIVLEDYLDTEGRVDDLDDICTILSQILDAVEYAHDKGLVHRDLKPGNVILFEQNEELRIKVLDFGVAKIQEDLQRLTKTGVILGSPAYMSPEQCLGEDVDCASDIYSLGCLVYELVTGRLPFSNIESELEWMEAHCDENRPPDAVGLHRPGLPAIDRFETVINKALEKKRGQRYQTIEAMKRDLDDWWRAATGAGDDSISPFCFDRKKTERIRAAILAKTVKEPAISDSEIAPVVRQADQLVKAAEKVTSVMQGYEAQKPGTQDQKQDTQAQAQPEKTEVDTFVSELNKIAADNKPLRMLANVSLYLLIASIVGAIVLFAMKLEAERALVRSETSNVISSGDHSLSVLEIEPEPEVVPAETTRRRRILAPGFYSE